MGHGPCGRVGMPMYLQFLSIVTVSEASPGAVAVGRGRNGSIHSPHTLAPVLWEGPVRHGSM